MCVDAPTIARGHKNQTKNCCIVMAFGVDALLRTNQKAKDLRTEQIQKVNFLTALLQLESV
jgi:hypothetical protein